MRTFQYFKKINMSRQNFILFIGILAMSGLVIGTFLEGGSLLQKILFLIGALALTVMAYTNKQKMFLVIEIVVSLSAILAFWDIWSLIKYLIFIGGSIIGIGYLLKIKYSQQDKWWFIGGLGLLLIAAGFATNPITYPILFNVFLGLGGIFVALYSALGLFLLKVRIAAIWLILNIFFSINPMIIILSKLLS